MSNEQSDIIEIKEYKQGEYISFYDVQYAPYNSNFVIQKTKDEVLQTDAKTENKNNIAEIGRIYLADMINTSSKCIQKDSRIKFQNSFILNYFDNVIKKEISLLKLNYGFFQNLSDHQVGQLPFCSKVLSFTQKEPVYANGDLTEFVYIVRKGCFIVLWKDQADIISSRKPIFSESDSKQMMRRWSLKAYEAKDIFGEEEILDGWQTRCVDVICESCQGQVLAIPKNYFLSQLYPLLQDYFNTLTANKKILMNERITQIRSQQNRPYGVQSPASMQSTQPISRECRESSISSYSSISPKSAKIQSLPFCQLPKKEEIIQSLIDTSSKKLMKQSNKIEENKQSLELQIKLLDHSSNHIIQKKEQFDNGQKNKQKKDIRNQNQQKIIQNLRAFTKQISKEEIDSQYKLIQFNIVEEIDKSNMQKSGNNIQSEKNISKEKNSSNTILSKKRISPLQQESNSLSNIIKKSEINISESPQKQFHHLQNVSYNDPQSQERRNNKKTTTYNTIMKRQANRVSPILDKAIFQKSSSESASQGTNNSGGGGTFIQALQQGSKKLIQSVSKLHSQTFISNNSSSISHNSSLKTMNPQNNLFQTNSMTQDDINHVNQTQPDLQKQTDLSLNNQKSLSQNFKFFIQNLQQAQCQQQQNQSQQMTTQKQNQNQASCFSKMVYKKIKEKEDIRKNLKKECDTLKKQGNLNALSDYSFKLGSFKIKSELLSHSYENLIKIQKNNASHSSQPKMKRKFSGDENFLQNKPKYLFTPQQKISNSQTQKKLLLDKIIGSKSSVKAQEVQTPFLNQTLKKDVQVLLQEQSPPYLPIEKIIAEKHLKPTISQRAIKNISTNNIDLNENSNNINTQQNNNKESYFNIHDIFQKDNTSKYQPIQIIDLAQNQSKETLQIESKSITSTKDIRQTKCFSKPIETIETNKDSKQTNITLKKASNQLGTLTQSQQSLLKGTKPGYYQNTSARNHYNKLKQLLSSNLASPINKNLSHINLQNQDTLSQLMNKSAQQILNTSQLAQNQHQIQNKNKSSSQMQMQQLQ